MPRIAGTSGTDATWPADDGGRASARGAAKLGSSLLEGDAKLSALLAGDEVLGRGSRGASLRKVQKSLEALGHPLRKHGADGRWHDEVRSALVAFQETHGLPTSGVVDGATVRAMDKLLAGADGALAKALADGSISRGELQAAERQINAKYGPERGRAVLIAALGQNPTRLEFDAVDYLQGRVGAMDGHIDRYQQVLAGHLAGAKILDANFDGRLDEHDLIFTKGADGKVDVHTIGRALSERVRIGAAMVDAAYSMHEAKHRFGDLEFNPFVWELEDEDEDYADGMGVMVLTGEVPASTAIQDIFDNPGMYRFECATALTVARYKAMLDLIGPRDFDRIFEDIRIGPWEADDDATRAWKATGRAVHGEDVEASAATIAATKPGDYAYFKNWDVSKAGFDGGWQGENVIFLGDGLYYGHPFGVTSAEAIVEHLNENRKRGSTRSASLLDLRANIGRSILAQDKDPYG